MTQQASTLTLPNANMQLWAPVIYDLLKAHAVTLISYVADAGHSDLITLCQTDVAILW